MALALMFIKVYIFLKFYLYLINIKKNKICFVLFKFTFYLIHKRTI